jgi:hypothetical protein
MAATPTDRHIRYAGKRILRYRPRSAADEFHRSQAKNRWLFGGNRSGKSEANIGFDLVEARDDYNSIPRSWDDDDEGDDFGDEDVDGFAWVNQPGRERLVADKFSPKKWEKIRTVVGLPESESHHLRKTFASLLAQRGVSTAVTQRLLKHSSPSLQTTYTPMSIRCRARQPFDYPFWIGFEEHPVTRLRALFMPV